MKFSMVSNSRKTICSILITIFIFLSSTANAQDGFIDPYAADVPIDGGLSLLVAAGVAFGVKKIYRKKSSSTNIPLEND